MSVQAGIWNFDGQPIDLALLDRISSQTAAYGPDGEVTHIAGDIGILYRSFHTTAESRLERQPHAFASGKVITWDGRLDNRDDLISQLGDPLDSRSTDVAVVAAAFEKWDVGCFAQLVGDWALAVWDRDKQELILARDYMGIRQLFYYPKPTNLAWCSNLAPLALLGDKLSLCEEYIAGYLALHPDAHLTPYREIHSVPPGKFIRIRGNGITAHAYWVFPRIKTRYRTDVEYEEHYLHLFRQAVSRRLRTDSPIVAELSGGLDSSSIVCMADDILSKDASRLEPIS